jgi:hypothetical protein
MEAGNMPFHEWSSKWLSRNFNKFNERTFFFPVAMAFIAMLGYFALREKNELYTIILSVLFTSMMFWFFSAPDIRFARGIAWLWAAFSVLAFYDGGFFSAFYNVILRHIFAILVIVLLVEEMLMFYIVLPDRHFDFSWEFSWRYLTRSASRPVKAVILNNGQTPPLVVWVPENSDRCGDAPLPCTPYPNDRLCLFVPGNLGKGFYLKRE